MALFIKGSDGVQKDKDGVVVTDSREVGEVCKAFYTNLLKSSVPVNPPSSDGRTEREPPILISEVERALKLMNKGKAPGKDEHHV